MSAFETKLSSQLFISIRSLAPWTFYSRWCRCLWSLTWLSLSLSFPVWTVISLCSFSLSTSHPSSADNRNLYIFSSLPSQSFPSQPREMLQLNKLFIISLSPLNVPVLLPSLLSFSISLLRLSTWLDSTRLDLTPTSCHRNEQPTLYVHSIVLFTFFPLSVRRKSLSRKLLSFNRNTIDTDKYIFIYQIQTYTDPSLIFSISSFLLTLVSFPLQVASFYLSPSLCVIISPF